MDVMALLVFFLSRSENPVLCLGHSVYLDLWDAWLVALWYIRFDTYNLFTQEQMGPINLVAHVAGVAVDYGIGSVFYAGNARKLSRSMCTPVRMNGYRQIGGGVHGVSYNGIV